MLSKIELCLLQRAKGNEIIFLTDEPIEAQRWEIAEMLRFSLNRALLLLPVDAQQEDMFNKFMEDCAAMPALPEQAVSPTLDEMME